MFGETVYTVVAGDTLDKIAKKYGTTYQELAKANMLDNPNLIEIGQEIYIPSGGTTPSIQIPLAISHVVGQKLPISAVSTAPTLGKPVITKVPTSGGAPLLVGKTSYINNLVDEKLLGLPKIVAYGGIAALLVGTYFFMKSEDKKIKVQKQIV